MRKFWISVVLASLPIIYLAVASPNAGAADNSTVSVGPGIRYICQTSAPAPVGRARAWVRCSDGHQMYTDPTNVDLDVSAGNPGSVLSVKSFGAAGDGVTDDTASIQAAVSVAGQALITDAASVSTVYLPAGNFYITDTITISRHYVNIRGAGVHATKIIFNPSSAKSAFKFSMGATQQYGSAISGVYFAGQGTQKKTAVEVDDNTGFDLADVWVDPRFGASTWTGNTSVGLLIRGREAMSIRRFRAYCDRPIEISTDPNISTIGADSYHFTDTYLRPTPGGGEAAVRIDDGVVVLNLTFDGHNNWLVDKYGLYWADTSSTVVSQNVLLQGIRCEQHQDATGTSFYVSATGAAPGIQNFQLNGCENSSGQNAVYLRGIFNASIRNCVFNTNDATKKHLDVDTTFDLWLENNYVQDNTATSINAMTKLFEVTRRTSAATMGPTAHWSAATTNPTTIDSVAELDVCPAATSCVVGSGSVAPSFPGGITVGSGKNIVGSGQVGIGSSGIVRYFVQTGGNLVPGSSNSYNFGSNSAYMAQLWGARYQTLPQVIAAASSITISPSSGDKVRINLGATAITSLTMSAGNDGENATVCVAEDSTGSRTIPSTWTNVRFAGGSYTATATANKIDCLFFMYDSTAASWLETGRALNL